MCERAGMLIGAMPKARGPHFIPQSTVSPIRNPPRNSDFRKALLGFMCLVERSGFRD